MDFINSHFNEGGVRCYYLRAMLTDFCRYQLPALITQAGTPQFLLGMMGATSRAIAHVDVCALFSYDDALRPAGFATACRTLEDVTRQSAERYVSDFGLHDPLRRTLLDVHEPSNPLIFSLRIEDIDHLRYREMNYVRTDTVERISIAFPGHNAWYAVNFYRKKQAGRFRPDERDALNELAPIMSSLVLKHVELTESLADCHAQSMQERIANRLRGRSPSLSDRECEICTLITLGHTSEAIAMKLGVSANTVLTYRKRAYAKLEIGSQNELFRICLDGL